MLLRTAAWRRSFAAVPTVTPMSYTCWTSVMKLTLRLPRSGQKFSQLSPEVATMRQGPPPITAAGVKATLKSLRTRVGLQPDRITSTSLALDDLERLSSVRYLQGQGLDRAAAIVQAVRDAAQTLPITESLIVDAALSLRMNEVTASVDLYAADLSDRRVALLQEWDALHAAHDGTPPSPPTARSLRFDREDAALELLAGALVAEELEGRRPSPTRPSHETSGENERAAVVIGAAVYDISFHVPDIPAENTSVQAYAFEVRPGGKGLNQAVGLARLGTKVKLISPLGSDEAGREILEFLLAEGVDTDYVETRRARSPRVAVLALKNGSFAHIGWKNEHEVRMSNEFLRGAEFKSVIDAAAVVLLTLEPPRDTIGTVIDVISQSKHCPLIVTASPPIEGPPLSGSELRSIDYLVANEWELGAMLEDAGGGHDTLSTEDIVQRLLLAGVGTICVLGRDWCRIYGVPDDFAQPQSAAVITTDRSASKDAFTAALASKVAIKSALTEQDYYYAYHAMLVAGERFGTSSSLPRHDEITSFEERLNEQPGSGVGDDK
jgi:sugar/nucleoside kinase (ribokinase family)